MNKLNNVAVSIFFTAFFALVLALGACSRGGTTIQYNFNTESRTAPPFPNVSFAVISDTHIYHPSLGSSGAAFEAVMNADRKLLPDSIDLINHAIDLIIDTGVDFILIPGDLSKDGEMINHRLLGEMMGRLNDAGIAVFVVPGNHDINSPDSVRFEGDNTVPVPVASAADFEEIYADFGFRTAILRDDDSLSYVAEPVPGLWLLAIDAIRYRDQLPDAPAIVEGAISQKTADWIAEVLSGAERQNKAVITMLHHGVVEHWRGKSKMHPDYLINDFTNFGRFLASWNVRAAFTGHYHAQDIVRGEFGEKFLYDIQTGSLVTAPCPLRFVEIRDNVMHIRTHTIVDELHPGTDFAAVAHEFVKRTVALEAASILRRFRVSQKDTDYISNAAGDAFVAHYSGDEDPALRPSFDRRRLNLWGRFVFSQFKYVLDGLWEDLPPADNNVSIRL